MTKTRASTGRAGGGRPQFLRLRTKLSSLDEFVKAFSNFVDDTTLFISSRTTVPVGLRRRFVVTLGDGQEVFCGEGEIVESPARLSGPGSPVGMRLRLLRIDEQSRPLHARLLARRRERASRASEPPSAPVSEDEETTRVSDEPRRLAAALADDVLEASSPPGGAREIPKPGGPPVGPKPAGVPRIPKPDDPPRAPSAPLARPLGKAGRRLMARSSAALTNTETSGPKPTEETSTHEAEDVSLDEVEDLSLDEAEDVSLDEVEDLSLDEAEDVSLDEAEDVSLDEEVRADSALPLPAPPDAVPAAAPREPRADSAGEQAPAAPAADPPARPLSTRKKKLAAFVATAALAVFAAYLGLADRGAASQKLAEARAADDMRDETSISGGAPDSTGSLAGGPADRVDASVDARNTAPEDVEEEIPGDDVALENEPLPDDEEVCVAHLDSTPRGASATVDGIDVGETPVVDLPVDCDVELTVRLAHRGFQEYRQRLKATPDSPLELAATLRRQMSRLRVETTPPGATVTINGDVVGSAPVDARVRHSAPVHITATLRGYKVWTQQMRPRDARVTVRAELERIGGP